MHLPRRRKFGQSLPTRRDFLKLAAASLGGAVLTGAGVGCGGSIGRRFGSGPGGGPPLGDALPNGYRFWRVLTTGDGQFADLKGFSGGVMMNDSNVLVHALRTTNSNALFQLTMNYSGDAFPTIGSGLSVAAEGDFTPEGRLVTRLMAADVNNQGVDSTVAMIVGFDGPAPTGSPNTEGTNRLYVGPGLDSAYALVNTGDPTPNGGYYGAHFTDVSINDNTDIMLVADYAKSPNEQGARHLAQGVFYLPGASGSDQGSLEVENPFQLPGTNQIARRFGLCDLDNSANYVLQTFATPNSGGGPEVAGGRYASGVLTGRVGSRPGFHVGAAGMGTPRAGTMPGNVYMGPRVRGNNVTSVVHVTDDDHVLYYNNKPIAASNAALANGGLVAMGVGPASISDQGHIHFVTVTTDGVQLNMSNGGETRTILTSGTTIPGSGNPLAKLVAIVHGYHSAQVDSQGRVVFIGDFDDESQSVVIGIPI